jgi:hypothetical protein
MGWREESCWEEEREKFGRKRGRSLVGGKTYHGDRER